MASARHLPVVFVGETRNENKISDRIHRDRLCRLHNLHVPKASIPDDRLLAILVALGIEQRVLAPSARAQTVYSVEGANRFVRAKDWNGLGQYASAWTKAEPNNPLAWYYLGNNYATGLQQPDAAIPAFQQVVRLDPNRHGAWQTLGVQFMKVKRYEDAVRAFKRATELEPRKPNYWNNLASAYRETRQFDLAVAALDNNMKLAAPHGNWADWHNLGTAYRNLGLMWGNERDRQNKAVIAFRQSLKLNPRSGEGWNSLGATYQTLSNYDEAFRCLQASGGSGQFVRKAKLRQPESCARGGGRSRGEHGKQQ